MHENIQICYDYDLRKVYTFPGKVYTIFKKRGFHFTVKMWVVCSNSYRRKWNHYFKKWKSFCSNKKQYLA